MNAIEKIHFNFNFLPIILVTSCSEPKKTKYNYAAGEFEIIINPGDWELSGTLFLPEGEGPFPVVIFAHGSGPADRDETIGNQKLFMDLAYDLAELGIASIRYDKRTYIYTDEIAEDRNFTVKEEIIDDVLHAVNLAKRIKNIDSNLIFIAGHSLGGYLIPRIDKQDEKNDIKGYIFLAGPARPILDIFMDHIEYLLSISTDMSESEKQKYKEDYAFIIKQINRLTENDRGRSSLILGAYSTYWIDIKQYDPTVEVLGIKERMLFLQGEHDYQVTMTDFNLWKSTLQNNQNATFISYKKLTHTFAETESMSTPNDYLVSRKVDSQVSIDIKNFISE